MHGQDHRHQAQWCHHHRLHHRPHPQRLLPSTRTLHQWGFFLLIILPLYTTVIWCLLSRPIHTSILQFTTATMVWSVNPAQSLILIHNENLATSYADGRTLTSQLILPAAATNTFRHPHHLLTMLGLSSVNDPSKPSPDTWMCVRSSFEKIRVRPPCCQLGQTMKCRPKPSTPLW